MSLLKELEEARTLTEWELDIRRCLPDHPETLPRMSCRQLGEVPYTSAAVTRFCQKFGCGDPDFKSRLLSGTAVNCQKIIARLLVPFAHKQQKDA